ncbi:MAG TPA: TonB C-terminal domain-containing protein [Candidatus Acidoferrum sp.]|nr:TonB C-terminal domain-containing protein [Methylomirabilota bacterium]HUK30810.1 TonB C-terminal domain-containing protein [Candidatus Acidoferrum sp.]
MIPRLLVPIGARPPAGADAATQRRRPTTLDERTLVQAMLPIVPLNGQSTIPTNLPLESIAARVVVPRDISREAYGVREDVSTPLQPTDLDERITVPVGAAPPPVIEPMTLPPPEDLVEPDIFLTGEVHLSVPEKKEEKAKWQIVTRFSSVAFHLLLLAFILLQAKLFPPREPSQSEIDLARRQLTLLLPPGAFEPSKPSTPKPPQPLVHVDPRILREVAPPIVPAPTPAPQPERPVKELPSAPIPKTEAPPSDLPVTAPTPKADAPKAPLKLEAPDTPQPQHGLIIPKSLTSGSSVGDTARSTPRISAPRAIVGGGRVSGGARGGGGSGGTAYGGLEMLTPDQGVDFSSYLQRIHDVIERNWFAVMPPSVELGDRGIVVLTFKIMRDGSVVASDPVIEQHSGKEPLDRAAFSSIRASNPFDRLPPQFSGPFIELRCTYLYNIPLEEYYRQR